MIAWTKDFETGSAKLDQQHRLLIDNVNLLKELLETPNPGKNEAELTSLLVEYLEAYANIHFSLEEHCMEAYRCPALALNQQEHQRLRTFIQDYKRQREIEGFKVELLQKLHEVMRNWIIEHILKVDTQLKPCILRQPAAA